MRIRKKVLTNDCKKCELKIDGEGRGACGFGHSKATKILVLPKGKKKSCRLIRKGNHE